MSGCSSVYKPTTSVLEMSRSMSKAEAMDVVMKALVTPSDKTGICGGSGLPGKEVFDPNWEMNEENSDLAMSNSGFSVNAFRRVAKATVNANYLHLSSITSTTRHNLEQAFRQSINYSDIEYVKIFNNKGLEYRMCYIHEEHSGVMMGLKTGFGDFYGITIEKANLERFIAAMMILAPNAEVQVG